MSKLNSIKEKNFKQPKVWLENITFDFEADEKSPLGPHIHYAIKAASMRDEPLLLKSLDNLNEEEKNILEVINKDINKTKENEMDETLRKEMEEKNDELQKKLDETLGLLKAQKDAAEKAEAEKEFMRVEKSLESFQLDTPKEVAAVLVKLDDSDRDIITKAFDVLKKFEVAPKEETELQKKLSKEVGAEGDAEVIEKSINERIAAYRK